MKDLNININLTSVILFWAWAITTYLYITLVGAIVTWEHNQSRPLDR